MRKKGTTTTFEFEFKTKSNSITNTIMKLIKVVRVNQKKLWAVKVKQWVVDTLRRAVSEVQSAAMIAYTVGLFL